MEVSKDIAKELRRVLKELFTSTIRSRGKALYKIGELSIESSNDGLTLGFVQGSSVDPYLVEIHYNEEVFEITGLSCDCPYHSHCKHEAAMLYQLLEEGIPIKEYKKNKKKPKLVLHYSGDFFAPESKVHNRKDLKANTQYGNRSELGYSVKTKATFLSQTELEITGIESYVYRSYKNVIKIVLKTIDGSIQYKCLSCNKKLKGFCSHQYGLMYEMDLLVFNEDLFTKKLDKKAVIKNVKKKYGHSEETLEKFFTLYLNETGKIELEHKVNILSNKKLDKFYFNLESEKPDIQREEGIISEHVFRSNLDEAILWDMGKQSDRPNAELILGPKLKTKPGLNIPKSVFESDFSESNYSKYDYINEINALPNNAASFHKLLTILTENEELIDTKIHYLNKDFNGYSKLAKSQVQLVDLCIQKLEVKFEIIKDLDFVKITRKMQLGEQVIKADALTYSNYFFSATKYKLFLNPSPNFEIINELFQGEDDFHLQKISDQQLVKLHSELSKAGEVQVIENMMPEQTLIEDPEFQIRLREVTDAVIFEPYIASDNFEFNIYGIDPILDGDRSVMPDQEDVDFLHEYLCSAHPNFNKNSFTNFYFLTIDELLKKNWFINFCQSCEEDEIRILGIKDLKGFKYSTKKAKFSTQISSGIDWFDVNMSLSFGQENISTKAWVNALKNGENFVPLKDGTLGLLPQQWLERAKKILAVAEIQKEEITISKYKFNIIDDLFEDLESHNVLDFIKERREKLEKCKLNKTYTIPKSITASLRDYQRHGYNWLRFLNESGFGGILADDMGLGKTLQVITLLATLSKRTTSLVIVPKSLLFNWGGELDKFCNQLTYSIHHGPNRHKEIKSIIKSQIVLTTYDTASSDIELLREHTFEYIVLDESQAIKNIQSKRYKAMRLLNSNNRLAMTGTPIENNTFDLYAQLSFTNPGLLNSPKHFRDNFSNPIDGFGDKEKATLLKNTIHPFILRRTKEQVARDLPEKTITTLYCEMDKPQRKLYDDLKKSIREDIENKIEESGFGKSRFVILEGLLRLRQMCNSPLLVNSKFRGKNRESTKIQILLKNLEETLQGDHSALVFSQFTSLLSIICKELDDKKIKYAYLDGKTKNREAVVKEFMNNDEVKLFLISIKAGNTGLNLTKADYVYIVDPWWNPAVEAQAIDRTHRIGQKKNIFAYKLICKDSIEEKILQLQEKKKGIANDIIQTDEGVVKKLSKKDLMGLFD